MILAKHLEIEEAKRATIEAELSSLQSLIAQLRVAYALELNVMDAQAAANLDKQAAKTAETLDDLQYQLTTLETRKTIAEYERDNRELKDTPVITRMTEGYYSKVKVGEKEVWAVERLAKAQINTELSHYIAKAE